MKKVLFAASECVPFVKTGGLADVVGSLPKYFDKKKYDVRVVLPKYKCIDQSWVDKMEYIDNFQMDISWRNQYVGIFKMVHDGVTFYFIDNEYYFNGPFPYSDVRYDLEKFAFFSKAVLSILPVIDFRPDIIHCHDWQTGLVPVYIHDSFASNPFYRGIKTIMTIHNLKFQGVWDVKTIQDVSGLSDYYFTPDKLRDYDDGNLLKGGIVYADLITTVSDTYAEEIKTPFYGEGLDGLLNAKAVSLYGIINGIDYKEYDPANDELIFAKYDAKTFRKDKAKNKLALQKELGLTESSDKMMIGMVGRLTDQKGLDLLSCVLEEMCQDDVQFVILGTGEERYENMFRHFDWKYGNDFAANICYSNELSHKIYAACDAFLMPSLFEPCGLSQLMSLRYGTLPIVRETGGLKDTVIPYNEYEETGTGFSFINYNAHEMMNTVRYAEHIYYDKRKSWNAMVGRAMREDFSWKASAKKYEKLYNN